MVNFHPIRTMFFFLNFCFFTFYPLIWSVRLFDSPLKRWKFSMQFVRLKWKIAISLAVLGRIAQTFFQSSYFSTIYSIRTWTNTQKHVFIKLRFTHLKPIWFLLSKLPNFTKLSISSILFNDFSFSHHITIKLLTKMFLIYFLYAKNSFPMTHIYDPFKRAYHSMSDLSPKGKKYGVLWKLNGLCRIR